MVLLFLNSFNNLWFVLGIDISDVCSFWQVYPADLKIVDLLFSTLGPRMTEAWSIVFPVVGTPLKRGLDTVNSNQRVNMTPCEIVLSLNVLCMLLT